MKRFMTDEYSVPNLRSIRRGDLFLNRLAGGSHHLYLALSDGEACVQHGNVAQDRVLVLELDEHTRSSGESQPKEGPVRYYYALSKPQRLSPRLFRIPRDSSFSS